MRSSGSGIWLTKTSSRIALKRSFESRLRLFSRAPSMGRSPAVVSVRLANVMMLSSLVVEFAGFVVRRLFVDGGRGDGFLTGPAGPLGGGGPGRGDACGGDVPQGSA